MRLRGVGVMDSFVASSYFKRGGGLKIKALLWFKKKPTSNRIEIRTGGWSPSILPSGYNPGGWALNFIGRDGLGVIKFPRATSQRGRHCSFLWVPLILGGGGTLISLYFSFANITWR